MVETSEREMVRGLWGDAEPAAEKFTSLQPTYEDSVAPDLEGGWEYEAS
jgi:hypothetical protein